MTRPVTNTTLAGGFAPADRAAWIALVEKTLKGAGVETLTYHARGVDVLPLYGGATGGLDFTPAPRGGDRPWDIRALIRNPSPSLARDALAADLAGGAASAVIRIDPSGEDGVAVGSAHSLETVLDGVLLDIAPIALDAGFHGPRAADWLGAAAKASPAAPLALHLDPLSAFARLGASPGPIESHIIAAANVAARLAPTYPRASLFLASGIAAHEAGAAPASELAFALGAALAYAKALVRAGLSMESALDGIVLGLAVDADPLISIAKLRAARRVWTRLSAACGAPTRAVIEARSSDRMLTRADPWTNLVRLTAAGFAGAVGGADALILGAFTDALGPATPFARRMARNTQLILMEEAHLGAVADPAAGAGGVEDLSDQIARAAWIQFNAIEAAGGIVAALRDGTDQPTGDRRSGGAPSRLCRTRPSNSSASRTFAAMTCARRRSTPRRRPALTPPIRVCPDPTATAPPCRRSPLKALRNERLPRFRHLVFR